MNSSSKSLLIHNPRCGKSRGAKEILEEKGISFDTVEYLKDGLSTELLMRLPEVLKLDYPQMIREKEDIYSELKLAGKKLNQAQWIEVLQKHPILLERPIFVHQGKGIIARPPEKVLELL